MGFKTVCDDAYKMITIQMSSELRLSANIASIRTFWGYEKLQITKVHQLRLPCKEIVGTHT